MSLLKLLPPRDDFDWICKPSARIRVWLNLREFFCCEWESERIAQECGAQYMGGWVEKPWALPLLCISERKSLQIHLKFIWNSFLISLRNRFWISSDLKVANCSLHQLAIDVLKSILDAGQSRTVTLKGLRNLFHLIATQWVIHYTYYSFGFGWLRLALEFGKLFINWSSTELHMNTKILIFVKS